MLGPFFPGKARRLLVRQEKRALSIEASFYGKSALLSYAKKVAKNPGGSARLKNMNSNANNWRIHIFSYGSLRFPPGPSLRAQNGEAVAFFERIRNNKNDIRVLASYGCVEK